MTDETEMQQPESSNAPPAEGDVGSQSAPLAADWKAALPEEIRNDPALEPIQDIGALAKSYVHAQRLVGRDKLVIPGEDAPKEEWDQFFQKLGRPEAPDGYELGMPEDATEEVVSDEALETFRKAAYEAGLSKTQAARLWEQLVQFEVGQVRAIEQGLEKMREEGEKALRSEWGPAYDQHVELAARAAMELGGEELIQFLDETGLGNSPELIKAFAKVGKLLADDTLAPGISPGRWGMTPAQARKELADLRSDPAFDDPSHPKHEELVRRIEELAKIAYSE